VPDDVADLAPPRGDRGDGGNVVGLERVLHAQEESQPQNTEHHSPARDLMSRHGPRFRRGEFRIASAARATRLRKGLRCTGNANGFPAKRSPP
jgi:hypothetical protein